MIKMKNLNNKGFVLAETLVVAVFLVTVFSIMYNNFYPLIGEYEKRETYDDVDSKYAIYWIKAMVQDKDYNISDSVLANFRYKESQYELNVPYESGECKNIHYVHFDCNNFTNETKKKMCNETIERLEVSKKGSDLEVYLTAFRLTNFKKCLTNHEADFESDIHEYVTYLPEYSKVKSLNRADARLIAKFHKTKDDNDYYTYSTIEVRR